jgi:ABC-type sugar transport system permease subunit
MNKSKGLSMRQREMVTGLLFISPWLLGACWFFIRNIIQTIQFSFNRLDLLEAGGYELTSVGWGNYLHATTVNVNFNQALTASVIEMVVTVPMIIFFSLFVAILLNRKFPMRGLVRAIFFLPIIMATTAITGTLQQVLMWMMGGVSSVSPEVMRAQDTGFDAMSVAYLLLDFGMPYQFISVIIDALANLYAVIRASGIQIIIFLAALQAIPGSMYEVSQIEGATAYEAFWKITIPMVSPLILTNVIYTIIDTYSRSNIVNIAYATAFSEFNFGLSAAMSVISAIAACLILLISGFVISKYVYYAT